VMHNAGWSGPMTLGFVERPVSTSEREMQTLYFYFGFFDQQMLVCRHTSRRPEFAYASSDARAAEFPAAVVAPEVQRSEGGNLPAD
jgi:hypothetical protein